MILADTLLAETVASRIMETLPTRRYTDIEYGQVEGVRLLLDVSVPEGKGPFPVVILVHGGGWASGDKQQDITPLFAALEGRFTWFSINYRLAPEYLWPAYLQDVKMAIRWIKANAVQYKGHPKRMAIVGYSVGGQLATLAANQADQDMAMQAVVGIAPLTDLVADTIRRGGPSASLKKIMKLPTDFNEEARATLAQMSAIHFVKKGQAPVLLLCGEVDRTIPLQMCQDYLAKLKEHGVPGELVMVKGAPHRLTEWDKTDTSYKLKLRRWLETTLRK